MKIDAYEGERDVQPMEPEEARRILRDEMPKKIERLRRDLRDLFMGERGRSDGNGEEQAA
jgi:hypothetical protein